MSPQNKKAVGPTEEEKVLPDICVVCRKPAKFGVPGTCLHEVGLFVHHLDCSVILDEEGAYLGAATDDTENNTNA